jgi:hypothetical protein
MHVNRRMYVNKGAEALRCVRQSWRQDRIGRIAEGALRAHARGTCFAGPLAPDDIDKLISAQLPDPTVDPIGYEVVSTFMMHGPCGAANPTCACMVDGQCYKNYPKEYCKKLQSYKMVMFGMLHQIIFFWKVARPNNGITAEKNRIDPEYRFVAPHNVDLLVKYQAHINVERVNCDGMEKYLFK